MCVNSGSECAGALLPAPPRVKLTSRVHLLRGDAVPDRLTYFDVRVGDTAASTSWVANAVCAAYTIPALSVYTLNCNPPLVGRYVVVRLKAMCELPAGTSAVRDGWLGICELQAYGIPGSSPPPPPSVFAGQMCACCCVLCLLQR